MWYCDSIRICKHKCKAKEGHSNSEIMTFLLSCGREIKSSGINIYCYELGREIRVVDEFILKMEEAIRKTNGRDK